MVSIIICHYNDVFLNNVTASISETIGVPYEIVVVDNKQNKYSLCAAYNEGARRSKYDILCFMHEDILFHTKDWGTLVQSYLAEKTIGIIGLCGGQYRSSIPGGWWAIQADYNRQHTIQHTIDTGEPKRVYQNPKNEVISDVVVIDGLWMCCRKDVWKETGFDEKLFKGFHFYDIDFSLQIFKKGYRVCVIYDISVEHLSNGSYDYLWLENAVLFGQKWEHVLPVSTVLLSRNLMRRMEYSECSHFLDILIQFRFEKRVILKYFKKCINLKPLNIKNFYFGVYLLQAYFPRVWELYRTIKK